MNRTRYLLARLDWKREYIAIQQRIRAAKQSLRDAHRAHGLCGTYRYSSKPDDLAHNSKWWTAHSNIISALETIRKAQKAMTDHLIVLENLKEDARRAWEAREVAA